MSGTRFTGSLARAVLVVLVAATPVAASAQTTLTFTPVCTEGTSNPIGSIYTEKGFKINREPGDDEGSTPLTEWCTGATNAFAGANLWTDGTGTFGSLSREDGGAFTINSIDLAHLRFTEASPQEFLTFVGTQMGGAQVFQTFLLPEQLEGPAFETFDFDPSFTNLSRVDFARQGEGDSQYQFSNIHLDQTATATPEPASLVLAATGFVGVCGVARRKRKTASATE